jgi:invasion protein IalB
MRSIIKWGFALLSIAGQAAPASSQDAFSSPAIDTSVYRDGMVQDLTLEFDAWTAVCREIKTTRQRVCNLVTKIIGRDGAEYGSFVLATDDQGKPALLLSLKPPIVVSSPLKVQSEFTAMEDNKPIKLAYQSEQTPLICEQLCKYMFFAEPKLMFALNEGSDVSIVFHAVSPSEISESRLLPKGRPIKLAIRGKGFAKALQASLAN